MKEKYVGHVQIYLQQSRGKIHIKKFPTVPECEEIVSKIKKSLNNEEAEVLKKRLKPHVRAIVSIDEPLEERNAKVAEASLIISKKGISEIYNGQSKKDGDNVSKLLHLIPKPVMSLIGLLEKRVKKLVEMLPPDMGLTQINLWLEKDENNSRRLFAPEVDILQVAREIFGEMLKRQGKNERIELAAKMAIREPKKME